MKILSFIIIALISLMSLQPCTDRSSTLMQERLSQSDHDNHPKSDFCSPLCSCACCGASVVVFTHTPGSVKYSTLYQNIIPSYKESFVAEVTISIWQPPKV